MLSVIIIAKNEEKRIRSCLESIKWADEIIVLDSGSTDKTTTIALEYTENVYETDWKGYGIQKDRALSLATGDWVFNLDADESVDEDLKQEIIEAMASDKADAYQIPIRMCFYGKEQRYSGSPSRHIRLFKRKDAHYSHDIVHEKIILPSAAKIGKIKNAIRHHSYYDISHAIYKMNRYSSYSAKVRIAQKKKTDIIRVIIATGWMFFRCFILQRGFLDGRDGLVLALLNAQGTFIRGLKQLYPDQNMQRLPEIKKDEGEA
ncbi:glycosyltransferase family 2 protein [Legionella nagasakiensis]|uniref:glycosyltransferase family 2 protein n=1 Tax=Legionella nagasakiensis TaxID=535290 RepID=UPI0010554EA2|nr:glycosyltransferase family 2 protein [Legionella nagasakiensis]